MKTKHGLLDKPQRATAVHTRAGGKGVTGSKVHHNIEPDQKAVTKSHLDLKRIPETKKSHRVK